MKAFLQNLLGRPLRITLLALSDFCWCFAVLGISLVLYRKLVPGMDYPVVIFRDFWVVAGMIVVINAVFKCYHGSILNPGAAINRVEEIRRLSFSVIIAYLLGYLSLCINGRREIYPLLPLLIGAAVTIIGFPAIRFSVRFCMKKMKLGMIRVFIAGAGKTARTIAVELNDSAYYGYEIIGFFDDDETKRDFCIHGKKWLGRIHDAPLLAEKYNVHYIICCLPPLLLPRIACSYTRTFEHVLVIPSSEVLPITAIYPTMIGFISCFEFQNRVLFFCQRFFKRLTELVFSLGCLILLLPLFVVLAILVKLSSPGPVFYTAKRLGLGGREIKVFKFRTMFQNADEQLNALLKENPEMNREWKENFKLRHDPRVTPVGRFLRVTSLDELPQFINVLRGEMALIGPRPIVTDEVKLYGDAYEFFKRVRPGITGLWQVSGRSNTDYSERVRMDMFYVMNWSVWLDWFILWKTILVIAMCKGSC